MVRKTNKTKSKRRSTTKTKRSGAKPLLAKVASVRTARPSAGTSAAQNGKPPISPFNPAMTVMAMMGRVMGAYAELPVRLSRCRHPVDVWFEQARFVQRVLGSPTRTLTGQRDLG